MSTNGQSMDFNEWPIEDLQLYQEATEAGKLMYLVYSDQMDAITVIPGEQATQLIERGVQQVAELPD